MIKSDKFKKNIKEAVEKLNCNKLDESYKLIINVMSENPDSAAPHNLLGLWYEMKRNYDLARKHYRAAYALDPTYKPAIVNLERVCAVFSGRNTSYSFGDEFDENQADIENEDPPAKNIKSGENVNDAI